MEHLTCTEHALERTRQKETVTNDALQETRNIQNAQSMR